ncbi:MAG: carboxypeptidase-like regulatory domain-containing protein [Bacteroidales bacterium]|nr:carboxypeptidase-like regulatory domain-containing protein [Bacteroidales bacterium]
MMRIFTLFLLLLFSCQMYGQKIIKGRVLDSENRQPLPSANIHIKGTDTGTSSDREGSFQLKVEQLPVYLKISYLNYQSHSIFIGNVSSKEITILMNQKSKELPVTEINSLPVKNLIGKKPLYVYDYAFYGDSLMLLTYPKRRQKNACLILMDHTGKELLRKPVNKPDRLYQDKMGNVHLFTRDSTFQLFAGSNDIFLLYGNSKNDFEKQINSVQGQIGSNYYVRYYRHKNQVLDYYRFDYQANKSFHFSTITSVEGVNMLYRDFYWRIRQKDFTEADLRFEEMAFYAPVFAPMVTLNDTIVILNYQHDSLEIFTPEGEKVSTKYLSFHHNKNWEEKLITDHSNGNIYALFSDKGIQHICKINLENGELGKNINIPDFRFVEKIKVNNNTMFFLYKDFRGQRYKKIYKMSFAKK